MLIVALKTKSRLICLWCSRQVGRTESKAFCSWAALSLKLSLGPDASTWATNSSGSRSTESFITSISGGCRLQPLTNVKVKNGFWRRRIGWESFSLHFHWQYAFTPLGSKGFTQEATNNGMGNVLHLLMADAKIAQWKVRTCTTWQKILVSSVRFWVRERCDCALKHSSRSRERSAVATKGANTTARSRPAPPPKL